MRELKASWIAAAALAACVAGAATPASAFVADAPDPVKVSVTRDGDRWTADYAFDEDAPVWAFIRSSRIKRTREPWRPTDWVSATPGVVLERVGELDVLRTLDGGPVPRRVSLRLTPRDHNLEADYGVLAFTDGSIALFTGAFDVFPLPSLEDARDAPDDLNGVGSGMSNARVTWRDRAGPVLLQGQRVNEGVTEDGVAYVLFGDPQMKESPRLVTVVDPQLPTWVAAMIEDFSPQVADHYVRRLGPGQTDRPTIMASWRGPTPEVQSMGGSVLPGLIVMTFEGVGNVRPSAEGESQNRWFISHESAHFWLGQVVRYERSRDAWITEGGADLMAIRATGALDPTYDMAVPEREAVNDCGQLAVQPVETAASRGEHRAYYACGAVFALVAEAVQKRATGGDWFDFLKPLIDDNREDGVLTRNEWLERLDAVSGDPSLRADIEMLLDQGSEDPGAVVGGLLERAGVVVG